MKGVPLVAFATKGMVIKGVPLVAYGNEGHGNQGRTFGHAGHLLNDVEPVCYQPSHRLVPVIGS